LGAVWGLALARLLGESALWRPLYTSPAVVGVVTVTAALLSVVLWRWGRARRAVGAAASWSDFVPLALSLPYVAGITSGPLAGAVLLAGGALLTALTAWRNRPTGLLPVLVVVVPLLVYLRTLLPSVGVADTFEFQVVVPKLGVAHPTGYPLYVLLARIFTLLPIKNVAWRVNLASAVFGVSAVLILYLTVSELVGRWARAADSQGEARAWMARRDPAEVHREIFAFLVAVSVAFSVTFWSQAVVAEVYTLHNLLTVALIWLLIRSGHPSRSDGRRTPRSWYAIAFLLGLGLTNHLTTALLIPAVVLALILDRQRWPIARWVALLGLFLLGLSLYLFIPLRWPALNEGKAMAVGDFLAYISGGQFHGALRLAGYRDPARWRIVGRVLHQAFGWPGIALAVAGVLRLTLRRPWALTLTGLTFAAYCAYGLSYYVPDIAVFLIPAHVILAIWMGVGAVWLAELVGSLVFSPGGAWWPIALTLFALMPLNLAWANLSAADRSKDQGRYAWGSYALNQPLEPGSAILADTEKFAPLYYLQQVEGRRPDLNMVLLGTEEQYQADLQRRLDDGQTVYLARYLPHLGDFYLQSVGPLVEVRGHAPDVVGREGDPLALMADSVELAAAEIEEDPLGRRLWHVTLWWRAFTPIEEDLIVQVRLVDAAGHVGWTGEGVRPVNGLYPTNAWPAGVNIADYHALSPPTWLPTDTYSVEVGLFSPFYDAGLGSDVATESWVSLGTVTVEQPSDPEPLAQRRLIALERGGWLVGVDAPSEVVAGNPFPIELGWRNIGDGQRVRLLWEGAQSDEHGQTDIFLSRGALRTRHVLTAPLQTGRYALTLGAAGGQVRCGWLQPSEDDCRVTRLQVHGDTEGLSNFGGRVLLIAAEMKETVVMPGELVPVDLQWRGLRAMDVDYTVFVHLVGPDDRLHGQVDSWPVQGTYPTSEWTPGETVVDSYDVRLRSDAPPGRYRVEVGFYNLSTMERVSVVDSQGRAVGDTHVVGTFAVER